MSYETVYTHHMIDDLPPQEMAMSDFRELFRLVAGCYVHPDGKTMGYNLKTEATAKIWLERANSIIKAHSLPLRAELMHSGVDGGLFNTTLNIIYKPF